MITGARLLDAQRRQCRFARARFDGALWRALPRGNGREALNRAKILEDNDFFELKILCNAPGEASETDIGLTGGNGTHQVCIGGLTDHRLRDADIVDHLVELVEKKAAEIEAAKQQKSEAELAAAQ